MTADAGSGGGNANTGGTGGLYFPGPAPVRVHVFSVGKDVTRLKQISQIDPALLSEFKSVREPTGIKQIWARGNNGEGGTTNGVITFSESILGKTLYITNNGTYGSQGIKIPHGRLSDLSEVSGPTGSWEMMWAVSDSVAYRMEIRADGMSAVLRAATTNASTLKGVYTDDYTPL